MKTKRTTRIGSVRRNLLERAVDPVGLQAGELADQRLALKYHPGFKPSLDELKQLGINQ